MLGDSLFKIHALVTITDGAGLHRAALEALDAGRFPTAELMFEAAVRRYRRELAVEAIARLRVHQTMAQVLSGEDPEHDGEHCLEVERRLCQLDQIESLSAPHELVDAHSMLGSWLNAGAGRPAQRVEHVQLSRAA